MSNPLLLARFSIDPAPAEPPAAVKLARAEHAIAVAMERAPAAAFWVALAYLEHAIRSGQELDLPGRKRLLAALFESMPLEVRHRFLGWAVEQSSWL